ncbi:CRTAC1 family protein [Mariniblastus fucicola]|uniref:ASPIC and UnbV n=1 Tax=Mariniblastus fucicola TaxID=980251 RepID=A0A5B9PKT8_9BACT|nr:CRTAC1 family protein [Mariniblastus fucicola]QEG23271.1 ASPIC and UnbV [Mariniblastus fucicola]
MKGFSFSGNERNRLFLNRAGTFEDATLTSGVDFTEDGRGFAVCDLNNDGILEMGIVSNQSPRFRIAQFNDQKLGGNQATGGSVRIRLIGGNQSATPNMKLSPRDPVGAIVIAKTDNQTRMFQLSRGEGFSSQNSHFVHVGLGDRSQIDQLEIRWPSGKITVEEGILDGSEIEISEPRN